MTMRRRVGSAARALRIPLVVAALLMIAACATTQNTEDAALAPAEKARLQKELDTTNREISTWQKRLRKAEAASSQEEARYRDAIAKAERSAGVAGSRGAAMSTGGMSNGPGSGTHLRLRLSKATWELKPRFGAAKRSGKRAYFPFNGGYGRSGR